MNPGLVAVIGYVVVVAVMSCVSFVVYGLDKKRAGSGGWRIPERTLHLIAFLGGWPGAFLAQRQFRHKTKKISFLVIYWLLVMIHVSIVAVVAYEFMVKSD